MTAGIDLLLHLLRMDWGAGAAEVVARSMVTPVFRPGSQAQYADTTMPAANTPTVEQLQLRVSGELATTNPPRMNSNICANIPGGF